MTEIKGPQGVGAIGGPAATSPAAARPAGVAAVGTAQPMDEVSRLFSAVADQLATGALADRDAAVRSAVDAVLARELPGVPPGVRDRVAADVATMLVARPDLAERMDRLLGLPG